MASKKREAEEDNVPRRWAYIRWVNSILGDRYKHITNLDSDLANGVVYVHLATVATQQNLMNSPDVKPVPTSRRDCVRNVAACIAVLENDVMRCSKPEEIVDGNFQTVVEFLFQIATVMYGAAKSNAVKFRRDILNQARERLRNVAFLKAVFTSTVEVTNLVTYFDEGMLPLALIHSHCNEHFTLPDVERLDKEHRLSKALQIAEQYYEVPPIIQPKFGPLDEDAVTLWSAIMLHRFQRHDSSGTRALNAKDFAWLQEQIAAKEAAANKLVQSKVTEGINSVRAALEEDSDRRLREMAAANAAASQKEVAVYHQEIAGITQQRDRALLAAKEKDFQINEVRASLKKTKGHIESERARSMELEALRKKNEVLLTRLELQVKSIEGEQRRCNRVARPEPPVGIVTMMATSIEFATAMWRDESDAMVQAVIIHDEFLSNTIAACCGYEVTVDGGRFLAAFPNPYKAVQCAVAIQEGLMKLDWPASIVDPKCYATAKKVEGDEEDLAASKTLYRGLRVRIALHQGSPLYWQEGPSETARMDYFGPTVNKTLMIERLCKGGQIVVSPEVMRVLRGVSGLVIVDLGQQVVRHMLQPLTLYQVASPSLALRRFNADTDEEYFAPHRVLYTELRKARELNGVVAGLLKEYHAKQVELSKETVVLEARLAAVQDFVITDTENPIEVRVKIERTVRQVGQQEVHVAKAEQMMERLQTALVQLHNIIDDRPMALVENPAVPQKRALDVIATQQRKIQKLKDEVEALELRLRETTITDGQGDLLKKQLVGARKLLEIREARDVENDELRVKCAQLEEKLSQLTVQLVSASSAVLNQSAELPARRPSPYKQSRSFASLGRESAGDLARSPSRAREAKNARLPNLQREEGGDAAGRRSLSPAIRGGAAPLSPIASSPGPARAS